MTFRLLLLLLVMSPAGFSQDDARSRVREAGALVKQGSDGFPRLTELLDDPVLEVRVAAVKSLAKIGTQRSLDPLQKALRDGDPEVQVRAIDSIVNFYLPGYLDSSFSDSLKRSEGRVSGSFPDPDEWVIDPYMEVRPEIIQSLRGMLSSQSPMPLKANAARALGSLRGTAALPELLEGLRSKDDQLIYQSLLAIQKTRAVGAAPRIGFLTRDPDERVQLLAIETAGLLSDKQVLPDLRRVLETTNKGKVRRATIAAMAMLPDPANRPMFQQYLTDKDEGTRAAAAEGLGRIGNPEDLDAIDQAWRAEKKGTVQLAMAFAEVALGKRDYAEGGPLQSLVANLSSRSWRGVAQPYLVELSRNAEVRASLYSALASSTPDQRIGVAAALGASGAEDAVGPLESLSKDSNEEVAAAGRRALRNLRASRK